MPAPGLLAALNDEIIALVDTIVVSTAIVTGQNREFAQGSGSAWVLDRDIMVTNCHVVEEMVDPVRVRLPGHDEIRATVVGRDALSDLAVLRVERKSLRPLPVRTHPPRLGELCLAFGSPLGEYPESVSLGLVSGLSRSLPAGAGRAIHDVIQTDCAINPGNSGGPLIGVDGRVIGVNTAVRRDAAGIGFAVPAETVRTIVPELIRYGSVERATLGVGVAVRMLDGDPSGARRLVVTKPRGEAAGDLRRGDVLLAIDGFGVSSYADVTKVLNRDRIGAEVPVAVWRDGGEVTVRCVPARLER